jgi:hypothetical protein
MRVSIRALLKSAHRTPCAGWPTVENMCVDHGRLDTSLCLDGSDVVTSFKQIGGWICCFEVPENSQAFALDDVGRTRASVSASNVMLLGRVDLVVGGSCWWTLPKRRLLWLCRLNEHHQAPLFNSYFQIIVAGFLSGRR